MPCRTELYRECFINKASLIFKQAATGDDLISVVIPAYNVERFIGGALASVLGQSYRNIEIIVVDDGSTDRTAAIVKEAAQQDSRVRLIQISNSGPATARNRGLAAAHGAWVATLDADDLWHPEKLAKQATLMRCAPDGTGLIYCWSVGIDEDGGIVFPSWSCGTAEGDVLHAMIENSLPGSGSTPLIRLSCIRAVGGYDQALRVGEDWQLYVALAGICAFAVVPEYLAGYRLRQDGASMDVAAMVKWSRQFRQWITASWPDLSDGLLRRHDYTVNRYLSFLALRSGDGIQALRFRFLAYRARPIMLLNLETLGFLLLLLIRRLGVKGYYWRFWEKPVPFLPLISNAD